MTREKTQHHKDPDENRAVSNPLSLEFDASEFAHFLDETGWSDEEKAEYITLIWNIMCEFVSLGFGIHPVQQAQKDCGKSPETLRQSAARPGDLVDSSHSDLIEKFVRLNGSETGSGVGGIIDE
jgi:hypothetical protein